MPTWLSIRMFNRHLKSNVPDPELLIFLPICSTHSLLRLSWWQLNPCWGPKPQNCAWLLSFLDSHIQSFHKFCWLNLQNIPIFWQLFSHPLPPAWSRPLLFFTWIIAVASWLISLLLPFILSSLVSNGSQSLWKCTLAYPTPCSNSCNSAALRWK